VLNEAKRRGAIVVGIDPIRTRLATLCDLFLQPRPGSDAELALRRRAPPLRERAHRRRRGALLPRLRGVPRARIRAHARRSARARPTSRPPTSSAFAALYAARKPSTILVGWGLARRRTAARRCARSTRSRS
jgi:anaerobic selenocysteine-containing dehydrogenase